MIKHLIHIVCFLIPFALVAQETRSKKEATWKSEKDYLEYRKSKNYDGPNDWHGSYPADMRSDDGTYYGGGSGSGSSGSGSSGSGYQGGIQYSPQQIQKDRKDRYQGFDRGGGKGDVKYDPEVERPDPIELPDIDPPDVNTPDIDVDAPSINPMVWKILLFILIAAAVMVVLYLIFKNRSQSDKKVIVDVENDWNPEVITKTELELKLEAAMENGDYRECVRIYFTFILKELIRKSWISWKKDKTNYHYLLEMQKRPNRHAFAECVRIYDLVWYGEYEIDRDNFSVLQPQLENYYKSLDPVDE